MHLNFQVTSMTGKRIAREKLTLRKMIHKYRPKK